MSTNVCYGLFGLFLHKTKRKTCFVVGREAVSIPIFHIRGMILLNTIWRVYTYCWSIEHWRVS